MAKGNRGEWSEFYAFLKLLNERQIIAADENLEKLNDIFFPVLKIIREEKDGKYDYELLENQEIRIVKSGSEVALVDGSDLKFHIGHIFDAIQSRFDTTFDVVGGEELMMRFHCHRLGAGNSKKEDITLKVHDRFTGADLEIGFSIKSMLGAASTLLNSSSATNFIYKINGLDRLKISEINDIEKGSKIRDRLSQILENGGSFTYIGLSSPIFERNLRKIDTVLPEILSQLLLAYYLGKGCIIPEIIDNLDEKETNILSFKLNKEDYIFKIKSLLHNVALGMVPNTEWNGLIKAHGGYIIVRKDGEIVCYHVYNADQFRNYLFKNTRFDTPSTSRHHFGDIYEENGDLFMKLSLQIRFLK